MFSLPSDVTVESLLEQVHPAVKAHTPGWMAALDAYDGEGGFLTGEYVWRFAREKDEEYKARKSQARYSNYCAALVDYYTRKVCAEVVRDSKNAELNAWLENVDGAGTDMTTLIRRALSKALAAGHVGLLVDKTQDAPTGPSQADERAEVFVTQFLPQSILDWRLERDETITAVKLLETVPPSDLLDGESRDQVLLWDRDEWVRVIGSGETDDPVGVTRESVDLGLVPLVVLRPFRSQRWPLIGKALLEPSLLLALYNRGSEQDNVLREQGFSLFVVSLPATGEVDVQKAKDALGDEVGSTRAVFAYGGATYQTPSMDVPKTQGEHQQFLIRELYRMAHIPHDNDSRDVQSAEAIRLTHEELDAVLRGVASECARVEREIVRFWCAWKAATPEQAAAMFESAQFTTQYPPSFFQADPKAELEALTSAMHAVAAPTFEKELQKRIVSLTTPDLDKGVREAINAEIERGEATPEPVVSGLTSGMAGRVANFVNQPDDDEAAA